MARLLRMTIVAILLAASAAAAQEQWDRFRGGGGRNRYPPRYPTATSFDGGFNFCRLMYTSDRREAGGSGWSTDYWDADLNFSTRLGELTKTTISRQPDGEPNHLTVRICRSGAVPVPDPERDRRRHRALHRRRGRDAARLSREGRLPLGR